MHYQLTYKSEPFPWITIADINDILQLSRKYNALKHLSGCLIYSKNLFVQILEGDRETIEELYGRIQIDKRHFNVQLLLTENAEKRIFSNWAMAYLNPKEMLAGETARNVRIDLGRLAGDTSDTEMNLTTFWQQVRVLLRDVGYYQL